jgi:flavin reductase (DIM6/NTAB) family NADH-FMN oxidoreductase RutF
MTASWGGLGQLWNRDVAFIFVRPSRHTFGFLEGNEGFSLSFFGPEMRNALEVCGSVSGRDTDKAAAAGITPISLSSKGRAWTSFAEARLVIACTKAYSQDMDPANFIDPSIPRNYPANSDYHRMYVGTIEAAWARP